MLEKDGPKKIKDRTPPPRVEDMVELIFNEDEDCDIEDCNGDCENCPQAAQNGGRC